MNDNTADWLKERVQELEYQQHLTQHLTEYRAGLRRESLDRLIGLLKTFRQDAKAVYKDPEERRKVVAIMTVGALGAFIDDPALTEYLRTAPLDN